MSTMFYPYTIRFYLILGINVDELMQWDYPPLDEDGADLGHVHGKYILVCIVYYMLTFVLVVRSQELPTFLKVQLSPIESTTLGPNITHTATFRQR